MVCGSTPPLPQRLQRMSRAYNLQSILTLSDVADIVNYQLTVSRPGRVQGPLITIVPVSTITGSPLRAAISKPGIASCFSLDTGPALGY
jgi:hypothetical protein